MKLEHWREQLRKKPVKYWIRSEIEEIVKEKFQPLTTEDVWDFMKIDGGVIRGYSF